MTTVAIAGRLAASLYRGGPSSSSTTRRRRPGSIVPRTSLSRAEFPIRSRPFAHDLGTPRAPLDHRRGRTRSPASIEAGRLTPRDELATLDAGRLMPRHELATLGTRPALRHALATVRA